MARLDDAVRRVLRVKVRAGLFESRKPSSRPYGGRFELLGSKEHRAVAREAVRESLVLLKNAGGLLPLKAGGRILVAGDGADNLTKQTGGWTLSWQGTGTKRSDFPNAQSIWEGIDEAVKAAGGTATLSVDGRYACKPDVAIVVFGEDPYAEFRATVPTSAMMTSKTWLCCVRSKRRACQRLRCSCRGAPCGSIPSEHVGCVRCRLAAGIRRRRRGGHLVRQGRFPR
nr:glycoside hydrolase family 3 C-terminal domain-containing protein [Sphingopyxis sp.]